MLATDPAWNELLTRAHDVGRAAGEQRVVLGIVGAPGAGKSTLAQALVGALAPLGPQGWVGYLPMDGFHLADVQLDRLGLRDRKGAPETFDAAGYAATLGRVVREPGATIYVPGFERDLEQPIAAALTILPQARLVITEGNYLLLPNGDWPTARAWLAQVWYVAVEPELRLKRLINRHIQFGKSAQQAREWVLRSDEANARLIEACADSADLHIALT